MPLFIKENINGGILALWELTENPEVLTGMVKISPEDRDTYEKFTNNRRKKEWLATRVLLREALHVNSAISYKNSGRPYLEDSSYNIGISHSSGFVALLAHKEKTPGVDIENINRSIEKVAPKFMSQDELNSCLIKEDKYSREKLFVHWSAKEAVFKMVPHSGIEFSSRINILPFNLNNSAGEIKAVYKHDNKQETIPLSYRFIKDNLLVWGFY